MMKIFLLFIVSLCVLPAGMLGQNLVKNPGFEDVNSFRLTDRQLWLGEFFARDWYNFSSTSTNEMYIHVDNPDPRFRYPSCFNDTRKPHGGKAYAAFVPYAFSSNFPVEILQCRFDQPLERDSTYKLRFYMRKNDFAGMCLRWLELKFSSERLFMPLPQAGNPGNYEETILKHRITADLVLDIDTANKDTGWVCITRNFKAKGGELFMAFGIFYSKNISMSKRKKYGKILFNYDKLFKFSRNDTKDPLYYPRANFLYDVRVKYAYNPVFARYNIDDVSVEKISPSSPEAVTKH